MPVGETRRKRERPNAQGAGATTIGVVRALDAERSRAEPAPASALRSPPVSAALSPPAAPCFARLELRRQSPPVNCHGSPPPATSPRSCGPPRCARRRRGLRIIIAAGEALHIHGATDHGGNVRSVPVTMAPVNVSVMTIMARQFGRGVSGPDLLASSLCGLARLAAFGDIAALVPSASASPVQASPVTGFRTSPSASVSATVTASARASGSVLRTTAVSTVPTLYHSIAAAAPIRRVLRHPFPFACTFGFVVPDRVPRLWFSHATQRAVGPGTGCHGWPGSRR